MNVISVVLIKRNNTNFKKTRNAPSKKILLYPFFVPSWLAASSYNRNSTDTNYDFNCHIYFAVSSLLV